MKIDPQILRVGFAVLGVAVMVVARQWLPDVPEAMTAGGWLLGLSMRGPGMSVAEKTQ
jgi:hypothetical protein